ncbi:MAG: hypothetical protein HY695_11255 [Deltaproteobacteria bacterium]|nr:hypothetical protein [Deltaproteobacteria bacterium]
MAMSYQQGLSVLQKMEDEQRQWQSAKLSLSELFRAAITADSIVRDFEDRKRELQTDIEERETRLAQLAKEILTKQKELQGMESAAKAQGRRLEAMTTEIEALNAREAALAKREARVTALEADLEIFRQKIAGKKVA